MKKTKRATDSRPAPRGERLPVIALCLMVGVVPLAMWPGVYEFVLLPKLLTLHVCIALCCLGWLFRHAWGRDLRWASSPLTLPATCWMGIGLLATVSAAHPLEAAVVLLDQAVLLILMFVAAITVPLERLTPALWVSAAVGLLVALVGILQYHGLAFLDIPSVAPPGVTFANRNLAAEYLVCAAPLSGLLFLTARSRPALILSGLSASLMGAYLVYTRTRSAWVGLVGGLLITGGVLALSPALRRSFGEALREYSNRARRTWALGFLLLSLILSVLPPLSPPQGSPLGGKADALTAAASVFQANPEKEVGVQERFAFWRATLRMIADHPVLGVGPGNWERVYPSYDRGATLAIIGFNRRPHNDYLWIASEYGLAGLGAYLWFLIAGFSCLMGMARSQRPFARVAAPIFAISLLAILGDACFAFPKEQPQVTMFFYLLLGLAAGATSGERVKGQGSRVPFRLSGKGDDPVNRPGGGFAFRLIPYLFLALSLIAVAVSWRRIAFDEHYLNALVGSWSERNAQGVLAETQSALEYGAFRPEIFFLEGQAFQNLNRFPEAEAAYRQAVAAAPYDRYAHEGLGLIALNRGRLQDALSHYRTALSLSPASMDAWNNVGVIYQQLGDLRRAEEAFLSVLREAPEDAGAHRNLAYVYLRQGRLTEALPHYRIAAPKFPNNPAVQWGFGRTLEAAGQPTQAEVAYRQAIALNPAFAQAQLSLGSLAYARGSYQDALNAYRAFLNLAPDDTASVRTARERIAICEEKTGKSERR